MKFAQLLLLEKNKLVMLYCCKKGKLDFFSYILCDANGVKKMHSDYKHGVKAFPYDYGTVLYSDLLSEPDPKAEKFLSAWLECNNANFVSPL